MIDNENYNAPYPSQYWIEREGRTTHILYEGKKALIRIDRFYGEFLLADQSIENRA